MIQEHLLRPSEKQSLASSSLSPFRFLLKEDEEFDPPRHRALFPLEEEEDAILNGYDSHEEEEEEDAILQNSSPPMAKSFRLRDR